MADAMEVQHPYLEGKVILIDKPLEWTSFQAVNHVRRTLTKHLGIKKIKVGHAGTLDPLATGLLLLCSGKFTKKIPELQDMSKEYTGTIVLGATRPSYDMETEVDNEFTYNHITEAMIKEKATTFLGEIDQIPPVFSAIKKGGKPLYEYARKGEEVEVNSRKVIIDEFEIVEVSLPEIAFRVRCGKGTYIRSLANDFGSSLGTGAYLGSLRRTKIGAYNVNNALTPSEFRDSLWKSESNP